ncbi:MAG TPA: endo-1,4-beta-xylanase [Prolixibacteraceae bacterium]|nr:endo-1,4-beta-xylanase [Prolixibacteraceae bacterium]
MKRKKQILLVTILTALSSVFQLHAQSIQTDVPALKNVFANDFSIGCLLSYRHIGFSSDPYVSGQSSVIAPNGGDLINYHMNCMSPGNNMKTAYTVDLTTSANAYAKATTQEEKDSIDTHPVIRFNGDLIAQLNWAKRQRFAFRGHTLVWHSSAPAAFFRSGYTEIGNRLSKEVMTVRMENYISEVIRIIHENWPGMFVAIDVVNEAISDNGGAFRTSGNEWYTTFGDQTYVMKAFELARKYTQLYGETQIKLYYNDYNTSSSSKADGIVRLCKPIYEAGLLDGIGMQEHNSVSNPTAAAWVSSYNKFNAVCNEMSVTELDVSTQSGTNTPSDAVLKTQANQYAMLFKCFVERSYRSGRGKIINVSKDGLNDQYTFVTNQSSSLWDTGNQCKPAFYAVVDVVNNYNKLDSLIKFAKALDSGNYSAYAWEKITTATTSAEKALSKNYSASVSAVDGLANACQELETSLSTNYSGIEEWTDLVSIKAYNGNIFLCNLQKGSKIGIYSLNGSLLTNCTNPTSTITLNYTSPCIIKVINGNKMFVKKLFLHQ